MTAAFIQNALYLKVKSSYEKSNVLLKYLSEWSTFRYIFLGNESRIRWKCSNFEAHFFKPLFPLSLFSDLCGESEELTASEQTVNILL